ncbi:unnamed protein product [Urochloa humidicola]
MPMEVMTREKFLLRARGAHVHLLEVVSTQRSFPASAPSVPFALLARWHGGLARWRRPAPLLVAAKARGLEAEAATMLLKDYAISTCGFVEKDSIQIRAVKLISHEPTMRRPSLRWPLPAPKFTHGHHHHCCCHPEEEDVVCLRLVAAPRLLHAVAADERGGQDPDLRWGWQLMIGKR